MNETLGRDTTDRARSDQGARTQDTGSQATGSQATRSSDDGPVLANRYALITGGSSGIGLASAIHLASDGARVTIMGRNIERLAAAQTVMSELGFGVNVTAGDVADETAVQTAVNAASGPDGRLDIVVMSAGTGTLGPLVDTGLEAWRSILDSNLTGAFLTLKHGAAAMLAHNGVDGGAFVAVSSIASTLTHRMMGPYCVSKAGLDMLVRTAADELGGAQIRVNGVAPSLVPTELTAPIASDPETLGEYHQNIPLGRIGTVDDVARVIRFLAGPESGWVTGQILPVDGGHTLRRGPYAADMAKAFFGATVDPRIL